MLINGQEVVFDLKQAAQIQADLNKNDFIIDSLKGAENPKEIIKQNEELSFNFDSLDLSDEMMSRISRYKVYREMTNQEFIHRGLEIIADDSTQSNTEGNVLKIYADEEKKKILESLFFDRIAINYELWSIVYETAKMGDNFYEIVPDDYKNPKKIIGFIYRNPDKIERIEKDNKLSYFVYKTNTIDQVGQKNKNETIEFKLQPWQIIHFKIEDKDSLPYGGSLLKSGVRSFRRLNLLEDVLLIYRVSRAPERRIFYVDVGGLSPTEAKNYINRLKNAYRSENFLDQNGNINKKANILSINSDIIIPRREGQQTSVETMPAGTALTGEDGLLKYFKDNILHVMNIPAAYIGEESNRAGNLSSTDIKFARFIERIQSQIQQSLYKIATIELFFAGYKKEELADFILEFTPPSNIKELSDLDLINNRMNIIGVIKGLELFSDKWILKNILKMSDKEIADIEMEKMFNKQNAAPEGGEFSPPAAGFEAMPPEEIPGETPEETPGEETEEELAASTIVKVLGKDFLIENKEDFFKLMKALKNSEKKEKIEISPMFKILSEYLTGNIREDRERIILEDTTQKRKKISENTNIKKLFIMNEVGGIEYTKKGRMVKLFEKKDNSKEELILLT